MGILRKKSILGQRNLLVKIFPTNSIFDDFLGGGIPNGITILTGAPGSGKSSFALQMGALLHKNYKFDVLYIDTEHSLNFKRIEGLFKHYSENLEQLEVLSFTYLEDMAEELRERLLKMYELQKSEKLTLNEFIEKKFDDYKAIFIWDSLASVLSKTVQNRILEKLKKHDDLKKTAIAETAQLIATILTNVIIPFSDYALPFLIITHMKQKIDMNPYQSDDFIIKGLEGKALKGGWTPLFLAHNIIVLTPKSKIDDENIWVEFKLAKSRLTSPKKFRAIFNYRYGYREDINLFYFFKKYKIIKSSGAYYKIDKDTKNYRKNELIELINNDIEKYKHLFRQEVLPKEITMEVEESEFMEIE